jgi:hypothetical protein
MFEDWKWHHTRRDEPRDPEHSQQPALPMTSADGQRKSLARDLAMTYRLLVAGMAALPTTCHGNEHQVGERDPSRITIGVLATEEQRTEPVGLCGAGHGELVAGTEQDPQRLTVAMSARFG